MLQISSNSVTGFQGTFYGEATLHIDSQGGDLLLKIYLQQLASNLDLPKRGADEKNDTKGKTLNPIVDITHKEMCKGCYFVKPASDGIRYMRFFTTVFEVVIWMLRIFHHSICKQERFLKYMSCGIQ